MVLTTSWPWQQYRCANVMGPTCLLCGCVVVHIHVLIQMYMYILVGYVLSDHCGHYSQNSLYMTPGAYGACRTAVAVVFTIKGSQR